MEEFYERNCYLQFNVGCGQLNGGVFDHQSLYGLTTDQRGITKRERV